MLISFHLAVAAGTIYLTEHHRNPVIRSIGATMSRVWSFSINRSLFSNDGSASRCDDHLAMTKLGACAPNTAFPYKPGPLQLSQEWNSEQGGLGPKLESCNARTAAVSHEHSASAPSPNYPGGDRDEPRCHARMVISVQSVSWSLIFFKAHLTCGMAAYCRMPHRCKLNDDQHA
jgi:hypothetical protein